MSAATSPGTGLAYGLRRVCAAWGMARSSFYAMTSGQHAEQPPAKRRGPKPAISDQALLVAIEADLEASPWEGEGYRKVWARLRVCRDIRVARKRVLRLMRENNLLSPHRCRRRGGNPHDGEIITHAPNLMWGTDGVRVFTVDDGWGWIFTAVEHWNAECVGWHVLQARRPLRRPAADLHGACRAVWLDRGRARRGGWPCGWITAPSICRTTSPTRSSSGASSRPTPFVAEPQTNGVAERFNRTLKEQIIHGRIYRNIAELRDAVRDFVELYNAQWIRRKERLPEPRSSSSGVARRDLNQARRVRQTCVQGTGCATLIGIDVRPIRNMPTPSTIWDSCTKMAGVRSKTMPVRCNGISARRIRDTACLCIIWGSCMHRPKEWPKICRARSICFNALPTLVSPGLSTIWV